MIWFAIAAICALAVAALLWPVLRPRGAVQNAPRRSYDLAVYRDQLAELDRDHERGLLSETERASARTEIERRMLAAADRSAEAAVATKPTRLIPFALAVGAPVCAVLLYLAVGAPWLGMRAAPDAAEREQRAEIARYVDRLAEHLRAEPEDARGWSMLGRSYTLLARYAEAGAAYARAEALAPHDADLVSRHAEAQIMAEGGTVGEAARKLIERSLALDATEPRARFYQGLAEAQAGRGREALTIWIALERDTPPDAPWRSVIAQRIERVARDLDLDPARLPGRDEPSPVAGGSSPPPTPPQGTGAEDRAKMIQGMVAGLAERLAREPNDPEGWARLGRSYGVLGERDKSRDAWRRAAELKPDNPEVLAEYASSLLAISGDGAPPPEFAAVAAALLRLAPDNPDALWFAGIAARAQGDAKTASV
jgi:cytochrome c-type biogenesis protein CcmH